MTNLNFFCSLSICGWVCCILLEIIARSFAYIVVVHVEVDMLKWYPMLFFSSHLKSDFRNMINMYGLRVSHCMVPWLIFIGGIVPK